MFMDGYFCWIGIGVVEMDERKEGMGKWGIGSVREERKYKGKTFTFHIAFIILLIPAKTPVERQYFMHFNRCVFYATFLISPQHF